MRRPLEKEIQRIRERFRPAGGGLFRYRVDNIKEALVIQVIETTSERANITLRVVSSLYRDENEKPVSFYLPIGEISPQYDLKNALIKIFRNTLQEYVHYVIDSPFEKPGYSKYLLLKLLFLLDQPGICYLFLDAAAKKSDQHNEYRLCDNDNHNMLLVNIIAHNIGGFLKDENVKKIFTQLGREDELDWWYGEIAIAKLNFLVTNRNIPTTRKRTEDLRLLKLWFFQRYDLKNAWITLTRSPLTGQILFKGVVICSIIAGLLLFLATFGIKFYSDNLSNVNLVNLLNQKGWLAYSFSFAYLIPWILFIVIVVWNLFFWAFKRLLKRDRYNFFIAIFEIFSPRLFTAIIFSYSLFYMNEEFWTFILSEYFHSSLKLVAALLIPLLAAIMFIYTKSKNDDIPGAFRKAVSVIGLCIFLSMLIGTLLSTIFVEDFMSKFAGSDPKMPLIHTFICLNELPIWKVIVGDTVIWCEPFSLLFWLGFSVLAGIFFQLFWQQEKITQPI